MQVVHWIHFHFSLLFFVFVLVLVCVLRNVFMEGMLNTPVTSNQILNFSENFIPLYYYVF